ncbi:D-alanyl-D-alanine carboxypeptidase family protein [Oerskovia sp. Sa1BUA8]|uniref:D-alanyl-D-alanine carboxypeptidase family protein n=1 Tax=Oerskovia douganii TaxID=2762210 RepID=A0A9D5YYV3_9CELL|nr:D-alanyl-D-alanine carboxypeptidase family protein [Oerskovia douganii]MBE7700555.1 D-alanyl-D-alanine carboxypeptidase family protein [Oerskovia douganii]
MTVGFVGSSLTHREAWSVQYVAEEPVAGAAFGLRAPAYEPPSEEVQLDRVVRMLDQSDEVLGSDLAVSEVVLQARSELGMLLATYQAQQVVASGETPAAPGAPLTPGAPGGDDLSGLPDDGLAETPPVPAPLAPQAPSVPGGSGAVDPGAAGGAVPPTTGTAPTSPGTDDLAAAEPAAHPVDVTTGAGGGAADALATDPEPGAATGPAGVPPSGAADQAPAAGAADGYDPESGLPGAPADPAAPLDPGVDPSAPVDPEAPVDDEAPTDDESADHAGVVTIDDVVAAATQLAELMGPAYALAAVGVVPADGVVPAGGTLADQLAAAVARYAGSTAQYANGQLPDSVLCPLAFAPAHSLRCDAAEQLDALAVEYQKAFGKPLRITDSYRSYGAQVAVKAAKPFLAAVPGTSQHGWGLAIDVGSPVSNGTSAEYRWMRLHAPEYGWDNPSWARPDGRKPEPWHFEFYAAGAMPDRYTPGAEETPTAPPVPDTPAVPSTPVAPAVPPSPVPTPTPTTPVPTEPPPTTPPPTTPPPTTPPPTTPPPTTTPTTPPPTTPPPTTTPTTPPPTTTPDPTPTGSDGSDGSTEAPTDLGTSTTDLTTGSTPQP